MNRGNLQQNALRLVKRIIIVLALLPILMCGAYCGLANYAYSYFFARPLFAYPLPTGAEILNRERHMRKTRTSYCYFSAFQDIITTQNYSQVKEHYKSLRYQPTDSIVFMSDDTWATPTVVEISQTADGKYVYRIAMSIISNSCLEMGPGLEDRPEQ